MKAVDWSMSDSYRAFLLQVVTLYPVHLPASQRKQEDTQNLKSHRHPEIPAHTHTHTHTHTHSHPPPRPHTHTHTHTHTHIHTHTPPQPVPFASPPMSCS